MEITPYTIAQRFVGVTETPGAMSNPLILGMLRLDDKSIAGDDMPWCSAFLNFCCWLCRWPRSKSLAARSWLTLGTPVELTAAMPGDVVVLTRPLGADRPPGPEVLNAPGHVGFFASYDAAMNRVYVLAGNQGDAVSVAPFAVGRVLGVRRLT